MATEKEKFDDFVKDSALALLSEHGLELLQIGWNGRAALDVKDSVSIDNLITQYEADKHADHIMQWKQDKIDYPEFWWELWQWDFVNQCWKILPHNVDTFFQFNCYQQHPHRENIIAYHACSPEAKKRWQSRLCGQDEWIFIDTEPRWLEDYEYRIRPKLCKVTLQNGDVLEYPEPVREPLYFGDNYWAVYANDVKNHNWINTNCLLALKAGLMHLTKEAAEQHLAVLQAINSQVEL